VGRTARGGASGVALSLLAPEGVEPAQDTVLANLQTAQPPAPDSGAPQPAPLPFDVREIEGFRYRVGDVMRSITANAVKDARLAELRREILASQALRAHFEDNPRDLSVLQHARPLNASKVKQHLKSVPAYLLPPSLKEAVEAAGGGLRSGGAAAKKKDKKKEKKKASRGGSGGEGSSGAGSSAAAHSSSSSDAGGSGGGAIPGVPRMVTPSQAIALSRAEAYSARRGVGVAGMGSRGRNDPLKRLPPRKQTYFPFAVVTA
jgi:ATP-dependent RNA helicase DDX56/DBP9